MNKFFLGCFLIDFFLFYLSILNLLDIDIFLKFIFFIRLSQYHKQSHEFRIYIYIYSCKFIYKLIINITSK
jgi:hypothetical protein